MGPSLRRSRILFLGVFAAIVSDGLLAEHHDQPPAPAWLDTVFEASHRDEVAPQTVTGDFNGDGIEDRASVVVFRESAHDDLIEILSAHKEEIRFYGMLGKGTDAKAYGVESEISTESIRRIIFTEMLLVVHGSRAVSKTPAKVHALRGFRVFGKVRMSAENKEIEQGSAGDSPVIPPPRLKHAHIEFIDEDGMGTVVYWDGRRYRWYPIGEY